MRSIGFGLERLALVGLARPGTGLVLLALLTLAALAGGREMRFSDDPRTLYRPALAGPGDAAPDPALWSVLIVEPAGAGPLAWEALAALHARLAVALGEERVVSPVALAALRRAVEATHPDLFGDLEAGEGPAAPSLVALRDLPGGARLVGTGARTAVIAIAPDPALDPLASTRAVAAAARAALAEAPSLRGRLAGLAPARLALVDRLIAEQPVLLGAGLAIGFMLGAALLGRLADAAVVAVVPVLSVLWIYGALGWSGTSMTVLVNNLPLLVLALAFSASMHVVHAARRDLYAAGGDVAALRATMLAVGPPVALSGLTTAIAFASFLAAGSAAVAETGAIGALAVLGVVVTVLLFAPVVIVAATRLGWRPVPPVRGRAGRPARALEAAGLALGRRASRRPGALAAGALAVTLLAGLVAATLEPRHSPIEEIPGNAAMADRLDEAAERLGGAAALSLPLPVALAAGTADARALAALRRAHEAAEAAFPGAPVLSPHDLLRVLEETGGASAGRVEAATGALPAALRELLLGPDGTARLLVAVPAAEGEAVRRAAARLEAAVGEATGVDLAGEVEGLALSATRRGPTIVASVALGLVAAGAGAALLAALAFRSAGVFALALVPNLMPVVLVGAALAALGRPLDLASAMALTVALGIAVDDTVHVLAAHRRHRARLSESLALRRTLRELTPVLVVTTLVLGVGLTPALWSISPAIATFAGLAIATLGFALLADLVALPALIALAAAARR